LASGVRELVQLALDEVPLGGSGVELERALVGVDGVGGAAESLEQVSAGDVQRGPPGELGVVGDRVEDDQAGGGSFGHRDGDGAVGFVHGCRS